MKTLKKSLAIILTVLTLFGAVAMCASAAKAEYIGIGAWNSDSYGVYLVYSYGVFDEVASGKEIKIYYSEEPYYYISEVRNAIENGEAELVGAVKSSNIEIVEYEVYGYVNDAIYVKPTFDFEKGGYYHFVIDEGLLVSSDGEYYSEEEIYRSVPMSSTYFKSSSNIFQKITEFFQRIIEWFKNLFSK